MPNLNVTNTHENDVIFNMDSLREFIKLIKRQGTENIDFYAVSELLQPPSGLTTVVTNNGQEDDNLPYWIELYNNSNRIAAENALKNKFSSIDEEGNLLANIQTNVYLFTPFTLKDLITKNETDQKYYTMVGVPPVVVNADTIAEIRTHFKLIENQNSFLSQTQTTKNGQTIPKQYLSYIKWNVNSQEYEDQLKDYTVTIENYKQLNHCAFKLSLNQLSEKAQSYRNPYPMNIYNQADINKILNWIQNDKSSSITLNGQIYYKESKFDEVINKINNETDLLLAFIPDVVLNNIALVLNNYKAFNDQINIYSNTALRNIYINEQLLGSKIYDPDKPEWWNYIYTKYNNEYYIQTESDKIYYTEFNERELKENPGKIVIVRKNRPWNNEFQYNKYEKNIIDDNNKAYDMNIKTGRHLYVQAGSLLKFNPGQSTEKKDEIDDYWTNTTPGTFSIDENDGQKAHIITIRGFEDGNFNNHDSYPVGPIIGYIKESDIPRNVDNDGPYKINDNNYNLTDEQLKELRPFPDDEYNIPVYWNNKGSLTTNVINTDIINADQGNFNSITVGGGNGIEFSDDLLITSTTEAQRLPNDPNQGNIVDNKDNLIGSIKTLGGIAAGKSIKGYRIYAAVFNDYAECRKTIDLEPGRVVIDNDDGSLSCANARLLPGAQVISDTYGNLIGETSDAQTPIAVSGRVLVYPYQDRNNYHAGMAVCSAPNGTIDIMTRKEIKEYPDCIIGIVSEIPNYKKWGTDQVDVNGRIWIKIK